MQIQIQQVSPRITDTTSYTEEEMQVPEHKELHEDCWKSCPIGPKEKDAMKVF